MVRIEPCRVILHVVCGISVNDYHQMFNLKKSFESNEDLYFPSENSLEALVLFFVRVGKNET